MYVCMYDNAIILKTNNKKLIKTSKADCKHCLGGGLVTSMLHKLSQLHNNVTLKD
jgi:hypothetical protein